MANEKSVLAVIRAARPSIRNDYDKIAFAVHASFLASGYVLTATGLSAFDDNPLSSSSTDEVGIDHWNEQEDEYAFVYIHPEKDSKKVLVKCLAMADKLVVAVLAKGASEPLHLEISVADHVRENGGSNYASQFKNLDKLVKNLDSEIWSKLDGYSKPSSSRNTPSLRTSEGSREPPLGVSEPPYPLTDPAGVVVPPVPPVGGNDLLPGPGAGMYPTGGGFGPGGSMLLGPNDPFWFGGIGRRPAFPGGLPGVPPGAHFDPYGPPGVPGFEPGRFARNPRRPPGGNHPDLEHFGSGSDFI